MVSAPFAAFLEAERAALNQRVLDARHSYPDFDSQGFGGFLVAAVDLLLATSPAGRERDIGIAAYKLALELTGQKLIVSEMRAANLRFLWSTTAPALMPLLATRPAQVLGMLSNAVIHLETQPGILIPQWIDDMTALAPSITSIEQLAAVGQIAAWRAGMAHFRTGALAAADALPDSLACAAVRGEGPWSRIRARLASDPWWRPGPTQIRQRSIGSFAGFGGPFIVPPEVRPHGDSFVVRAGEHCFVLAADTFGAVLHPAPRAEFDNATGSINGDWSLNGATLTAGSNRLQLELPADGLAACCNGVTIVITSPYTHEIHLVAAL